MSDWIPELPESIGPYRVLDLLGEGGMGVVYRCEQATPIRREIAVKVVRGGLSSPEVVRRFESERQALALMDHPNIAGVFDAGSTEDGRPYFAMQLVRGVPITEYADLHRLTIEDRLDLFMALCRAVQHAHQKGVIHRDLKPSNVIVTIKDGAPLPVVIDFGIAKSIHGSLVDRTQVTRIGESLGTIEYMSPEQAESGGLDVDTLTDVYSLGVILYELLVGALPFEQHELQGLKALATLRHKDPVGPSRRLEMMSGDRAERAAHLRQTEPAGLLRALRGDLDWITQTALAKDRTRRYETANALMLDVERFTKSEPVRARPPNRLYQARKFVARNRGVAIASASAVAAVILGALLTTVGMVRARAAEARAVAEAGVAAEVTEFLVGLFEEANPDAGGGRETPVGDVLDRGAERISENLVRDETTRRRLLRAIGRSYYLLGAYDDATRLQTEALRSAEASGGPAGEITLLLTELGDAHTWAGQYDSAEGFLRRAIELAQTDDDALIEARASSILGEGLLRRGQDEVAEPLLLRAVELVRQDDSAEGRKQLSNSLTNLTILYHGRGEFGTAEPLSREALEITLVDEPECPCLGLQFQNLAALQMELGRLDSAAVLYERARPIMEEIYGDAHIMTAGLYLNTGELYQAQGRTSDAEAQFTSALAVAERGDITEHPLLAAILQDLAGVWEESGQLTEAEQALSRAAAIQETLLGPAHEQVQALLRRRVDLLRRLGRIDAAAVLEAQLRTADEAPSRQ